MSNIRALVSEIQSIRAELKSLREKGTALRKTEKDIQSQIDEYLDSKDQEGLKWKGMAITREKKTVNKPKKKADQKTDIMRLIEEYGIKDSTKFLEEFNNAKKGSPEEKQVLKFKKYKEKS
jgi:transposase